MECGNFVWSDRTGQETKGQVSPKTKFVTYVLALENLDLASLNHTWPGLGIRSFDFQANCSFVLSDLSDSLTVAHFLWATWAIRSQPLICLERSERIAHSCSFDLSKMGKWVNERIPSPVPDLWLVDLFCPILKNSTLHPNVEYFWRWWTFPLGAQKNYCFVSFTNAFKPLQKNSSVSQLSRGKSELSYEWFSTSKNSKGYWLYISGPLKYHPAKSS